MRACVCVMYVCMYVCVCVCVRVYVCMYACTLASQTLEVTDLIHGMHIQFDLRSNMGGIPPGCTSSHWCVKLKSVKKRIF